MKRNILISTIKNFDSHNTIHYFYSSSGNKVKFCDAMAAGEAGARNILSKVQIDEIIAIGSNLQSIHAAQTEPMILREGIDFYAADVNAMTDFDFFRYRLVQYLEGMDIEAADLYGRIPKELQAKIIALLESVYKKRLNTAFSSIVEDPAKWQKFIKTASDLSPDEIAFAKRYLYHTLEGKYRVRPISQNTNITISFIPINNIGFDQNSMKNFSRLTSVLKRNPDDEIHLYVDMHGFSHEESYIFLSMIHALSDNPMNHIIIEEITSISDMPKGFIYKISNARDRYKVELLLSGINAFINYGKVDLIRDYWKNTEIKNDYIDRLMYAMDAVDTGMTLCNIDELETGIKLLRKLLHTNITSTINQEEESFILALRAGIINDYGPLVSPTADDIDLLELVKWAFSKGFYQQTITIIESRLPRDMVKRGILYYARTEEEKLAYLKAFNAQYWDTSQKDRYIFGEPSHFFIKYYGRLMTAFRTRMENKNLEFAIIRGEQVFQPPTYILPAYTLLESEEALVDILYAYYDICGLRNNINHAVHKDVDIEEMANYTGESPIKRTIRENLNLFIRKYMDVCTSIAEQNQEFSCLMITPEELDSFTGAHGPKDDPECMSAPGYIPVRERKKIKK